MKTDSSRRYLFQAAVCLIVLAAGTLSFIRLKDPYHLSRAKLPVEMSLEAHSRMRVAWRTLVVKPQTLIMGTSRAMALQEDHPALKNQPVFNGAMPSASTYEMRRLFEHALLSAPVKELLIGCDFFGFNELKPPAADFDETFLKRPGEPLRNVFCPASLLMTGYFSMDALQSSFTHQEAGGFKALKRSDRFHESELYMARFGYYPAPKRAFQFTAGESSSSMKELATILRLAHQHQVKVSLFISPIHVRLLEVMRQMGLWESFETWKRSLVACNAALAEEFKTEPCPLWDFTGYNEATTEILDQEEGAGHLLYFKEASHYTPFFANLILTEIYGAEGKESISPLSRKLTPDSIGAVLEETRQKRDLYEASHAEMVAEIETMCKALKPAASAPKS